MIVFLNGLSALIGLFPLKLRLYFVESLLKLLVIICPVYRKIIYRNLERAFPEKDRHWRDGILNDCFKAQARLLTDILRFEEISVEEIKHRVVFPEHEKFFSLIGGSRPAIIAAGHLGNFEYLAKAIAFNGVKVSAVTRDLKPPSLNRWWTAKRLSCGNSVIPRDGALRGALRCLKEKKPVAVLFDQNITRQYADFIDWFGYPAATTRLVGILAVRTEAAVVVMSIKYGQDDHYQVVYKIKDFDHIYKDNSLSNEEKVLAINSAISADYVEMIRDNPGEWFWMHKRWKTAKVDGQENFYKDL